MLTHHNVLKGLFLGDALTALKAYGWSMFDAKDLYEYPPYKLEPETPTSSRSLVSVLAVEQGLTDTGFPEAFRNWGKKTMDGLSL